jgi:hypothetical protein
MDVESLDKWDAYTEAKEAMFHYTDSPWAPWTVVKSNDKKRARLEAIKHVLRKFDYDGKNEEAIGEPDKALIGPPSVLSEHNPGLSFPDLSPVEGSSQPLNSERPHASFVTGPARRQRSRPTSAEDRI